MKCIPAGLLSCIATALMITACAHSSKTAELPQSAATVTCPEPVLRAVAKEFPSALGTRCKTESVGGRDQYEVRFDHDGAVVTVDVTPNGRILQTEVPIALDRIPVNVMAAFRAKYQGANPTGAEKQVRTGKGVFYELAFTSGARSREATFTEDGTFVDEE